MGYYPQHNSPPWHTCPCDPATRSATIIAGLERHVALLDDKVDEQAGIIADLRPEPSTFEWGKTPKRINGNRDHEPTPYCTGIGCKRDFHDHPGLLVTSLEQGHALGQRGLDKLFPVGSEFYYGPIYENMETRMRVTHVGHSGSGARILRDENLPGRPATWFVYGEVVSSPYHEAGHKSGWPPDTLIPADVVERERGIAPSCPRVIPPGQVRLEDKVRELTEDNERLRGLLQHERRDNLTTQAKLRKIKAALG